MIVWRGRPRPRELSLAGELRTMSYRSGSDFCRGPVDASLEDCGSWVRLSRRLKFSITTMFTTSSCGICSRLLRYSVVINQGHARKPAWPFSIYCPEEKAWYAQSSWARGL